MSANPEIEPIEGLPRDLPPGETIVWQGRPSWRAMARTTFKAHYIAAYLGLFLVTHLVITLREGHGFQRVVMGAALTATCLGILYGLAWVNARAAMYTITTKRVVLRIGVALPMTWNLPFKRLAAADLTERLHGNDPARTEGDISFQLVSPDRIAWLQLWPHAQPGHYARARPTLRAIAAPAHVARLLADAMQAWSTSAAGASRAAGSVAPVLVSTNDSFTRAAAPAREVRLESAELALETGH